MTAPTTARSRWLRAAPWEWVLVLLGVGLRLTFWTDHAHKSFDFTDHRLYLEWFQTHLALPEITLSRSAYGPPLYYLIGGLLLRTGLDLQDVHRFTILLGLARLVLFAVLLRLYLPTDRLARGAALALAAFLPAAIHIDGMLNNESVSMLLCLGAMALWRPIARAVGARQLALAVASGGLIGLAFLTKFSGLMLILASLGMGGLAALFAAGSLRDRWHAARPWATVAVVALLISGWCYARNFERYHEFFPTTFEFEDSRVMAEARQVPLPLRRPPSFYFGFAPALLEVPHQPSAAGYFWPTLVGATFSDYYLHRFSPSAPPGPHGARFAEPVLSLARLSVGAGFLIGLVTAVGLFVLGFRALRAQDLATVGALATSALAIAGQLFFSVKYPVDTYGVTKGTYLQFAAAPLFVAFGVVTSWAAHSPRRRPLAVLLGLALAAVAAYSLTSRWLE